MQSIILYFCLCVMFEMLYQIFALKMCSLPTIASHSVHNIVSVCLFDSSYMRINFVPFKWLEQHSTPSIWAGNNFYFFPFYSYVVHIIFNHKEIKRTTIRQKSHTEKTVARQNIGLSFGVVVMNVRERVIEAALKKKKKKRRNISDVTYWCASGKHFPQSIEMVVYFYI